MANIRLAAFVLFSVFICSAFAESAIDVAARANEVDTSACTKSGANMRDYCLGYCELESGMSCSSAEYEELADSSDIDRCTCTCGLNDDFVAYNNVPCGLDLMRKAQPISGNDTGSSFCCLPAFLLIGIAGFASIRR
jgi:hypothetical protein